VFSGIIVGTGRVDARVEVGGDRRFSFGIDRGELGALAVGGSVAVNGVCLTVVEHGADWFAADVSTATLAVTTFAELDRGDPVNLEPSLRIGDRLDGHWVTGHVDGIGRVIAVGAAARSRELTIEPPAELARYVAQKGSIAVDGVSLTVNAVDERRFKVTIIPHTAQATIIGRYDVGTRVNLEVDIVARYLERLTMQWRT